MQLYTPDDPGVRALQAATPQGPSVCPVSDVPAWWWSAERTLSMLSAGLYTADTITGAEYYDADIVAAAKSRAAESARERAAVAARQDRQWTSDLYTAVDAARGSRG